MCAFFCSVGMNGGQTNVCLGECRTVVSGYRVVDATNLARPLYAEFESMQDLWYKMRSLYCKILGVTL